MPDNLAADRQARHAHDCAKVRARLIGHVRIPCDDTPKSRQDEKHRYPHAASKTGEPSAFKGVNASRTVIP
jgi:hypothetical protein